MRNANTLQEFVKSCLLPNVQKTLRFAGSLWYSCNLCSKPLDSDDVHLGLCKNCKTALQRVSPEQSCKICGVHLTSEFELCLNCREEGLKKEPDHILPLFFWGGVGSELLYAYKNRGNWGIAKYFAWEISQFIKDRSLDCDIICPVPSNPKNRKFRGFDTLAYICSKLTPDIKAKVHFYIRRRNSISQKELSRTERLENGAKIFYPSPLLLQQKNILGSKTILLLDDVCTSGASFQNCAKLLKSFGAKRIFALCLFRD